LAGFVLAALALSFTVSNFAISSDTAGLISDRLDWRKREVAYDKAFPGQGDSIVVVIDGPTPELAETGADRLAEKLKADPALFPKVEQPDGGPYFEREGLLLTASPKEISDTIQQLERAQVFLGPVAADPSLRGLMSSFNTMGMGVQHGEAKVSDIARITGPLADSLARVEAGKPEAFSWTGAFDPTSARPGMRELRKLVIAHPKLDLDDLQPGARASDAIRAAAKSLGLDEARGFKVRLTGAVPLEDEEFASLLDRAWLVGGLMFGAIVLMLFLAVRAWRLVAAILGVTLAGLFITCAAGLLVFHRFNLISVAFIPLFVGLGVDFGIQFTVRWRAEQHRHADPQIALEAAAEGVGPSLTLAAAGIALGFLAFLPTDYVGVSQLGAIAGFGMVVALALNLTLLPAVIRLAAPAMRPEETDLPWLARAEGALTRNRRLILMLSGAAAVAGLLLAPLVKFDFNPLHLKNPHAESVATLNDLARDPDRSPDTLDVVAPSLPAAQALAKRLSALPEVAEAVTLQSFIPTDQQAKLAALGDAPLLLDPTLNPFAVQPKPSDAEVKASLAGAAKSLSAAAATDPSSPAGRDVRRLAETLDRLAAGSPEQRARAEAALVPGLQALIDQLRGVLQASAVDVTSLPPEMTREWLNKDGRARVLVSPKRVTGDNAELARFTRAVQAIAPDATGEPIAVQEAGRTISNAFILAGVYSFLAITALLFFVLRRWRDVALTLAPILLTGILTFGTCAVIRQPINDANIIAFPLLMGIGVAFQIYFVMAWRKGEGRLLSSSLARAVFFSALTTATGFGSLWVSRHPGTAGMGKLLMISLFWTLVSALIFQPALMGPVRAAEAADRSRKPAREAASQAQ
jgi:hopanoid biosynthesis associated RND transporter like protein HpnN